jgi:hypothetical protein
MSRAEALPAGRPAVPAAVGRRARHAGFFTLWAVVLTTLVGGLFTGVTAVTIALWVTDPGYAETGPVLDLAFFALGVVLVTTGLASQIRGRRVAGLQQTVVALVALAVAGLLGRRIEPTVGALALLVATAPLVVLHPCRGQLVTLNGPLSKPLAILAGVAISPAGLYSADMLVRARASGPSCFLGQCAAGDRPAEAAALVLALVGVALVAAARSDGWQLPAVSTATAAAVLAVASLALPHETGALGPWHAAATLGWAVALVLVAHGWRVPVRSRQDRIRR